jgi:hypothetical protein
LGLLDVFEGGHVWRRALGKISQEENSSLLSEKLLTLLLVYQEMRIRIDGDDDQIRQEVAASNEHQRVWVIEWDPFRHLHHHKDDNQVGTAYQSVLLLRKWGRLYGHLRRDTGHFVGGFAESTELDRLAA